MYKTPEGISAVGTITELRSDTAELVDHAQKTGQGILVQKNNQPYAVLLSFDRYIELIDGQSD